MTSSGGRARILNGQDVVVVLHVLCTSHEGRKTSSVSSFHVGFLILILLVVIDRTKELVVPVER